MGPLEYVTLGTILIMAIALLIGIYLEGYIDSKNLQYDEALKKANYWKNQAETANKTIERLRKKYE